MVAASLALRSRSQHARMCAASGSTLAGSHGAVTQPFACGDVHTGMEAVGWLAGCEQELSSRGMCWQRRGRRTWC